MILEVIIKFRFNIKSRRKAGSLLKQVLQVLRKHSGLWMDLCRLWKNTNNVTRELLQVVTYSTV